MMLLIRADGVEHDVDGHLTLESVCFLVGGNVPEHRRLPDGRHLFADGDGRRKGKLINRTATALFYPVSFDHVLGDVLILTPDEYDRFSNVRPFTR